MRGFVRGLEARPPIGEALALDAFEGDLGALSIGDLAVVVAEVELGQIAR